MNLVWSPEAIADLNSIRAYIGQDDPAAARRVVARIVSLLRTRLIANPESGRIGRVAGTRELVVSSTPFIVPYRVRGDTIDILRVYHAARMWPDQF